MKSSTMRLRQVRSMHFHFNAQDPCLDHTERISAYSETRFWTRLLLWARCHLLYSR
ncbi:hypothetical protein SVAN01_02988 [Stagonosporopsis vannaccii]|nr:hypothetical protein SVAN01_02988 [Stagonosporopsis vannaccii]